MRWLVPVVALVALAAACGDDDDDATPTSTDPVPVTTDAAPTTSPVTTDPPTTTSPVTDPPTTTVPPTTVPIEQQVSDAYVAIVMRQYEILANPTLDGLDAAIAEVAVPGSPIAGYFRARIEQLVSLGDRVVPNDPDILNVVVESVEVAPSGTEAVLTVCLAENRRQITPGAAPDGSDVETFGSGDLIAMRTREIVHRTPEGWRQYDVERNAEGFPGEETCPAP